MISRYLVRKAWEYIGNRTTIPFKITFTDGSIYESKVGKEPQFSIIYKNAKAEWGTTLFDAVGIADHYFRQNLDIEGDIGKMTLLRGELAKHKTSLSNPINVIRNRVHEWLHSNRIIENAKRNALSHYNRGSDMFRYYLDPTMTYTCAYWRDGTTTLEQAQKDKLDHVCRKLRLKQGETLVDIGGGWGSLLFHAHEKYGVLGTNVSPTTTQNETMQKEIEKRGLSGKIHIQPVDFREVKGVFDKYVSLGVFEHAGYNSLEDWMRTMAGCLKDEGIGVLHFIGNIKRDFNSTGYFIRHYIFPGGYMPGLAETLELMDTYGLEILDVENLRRHYAPTLRTWAENFDKNWDKIHALDPKKFNEYFRRMWRYYLYGCSGFFLEDNNIGLFQIVFSKGKTNTYPMTRDFLYAESNKQATPTLSQSDFSNA